ncbi:MAG TPA: tRNA lysidine(34) synthetase TilS [Candidatus Limnocylindria bacterium]|nr:tRNA lysidine(34) synthetase TilS [Candidatus Limnocylindria bacterium]
MVGGSNPPSATNPLDRLARLVLAGAESLAIPTDATLVLAVSGGPDSMALLHGAARLVARGERAWRLQVAHLDHALRPDSASDAEFVRHAADALGMACEVRRTDVAALARAEGRSMEDAAREARYRFLGGVAPADAVIATAHTLDDAVETVLLNLLRGSGLAGARGMPARRGRVVRPLLGERRVTLRALLDDAGLAYRLDPSNADPAHLRNRVRAELLPLLEQLRSGAVERIGQFARLAADDDALLDEFAAVELARRRGADGAIDWHDPPPMALGRRMLRLAVGEPAPSAERIEALLDAAAGDRGGVTIQLGGGRIASVRSRRVAIE